MTISFCVQICLGSSSNPDEEPLFFGVRKSGEMFFKVSTFSGGGVSPNLINIGEKNFFNEKNIFSKVAQNDEQ